MKTIQEFRNEHPQYNDMDDQQLTKSLHAKHYADVDFNQFSQNFIGTKSGLTAALGAGIDQLQETAYRSVKGFTNAGLPPDEDGPRMLGPGGSLSKFADRGIERNTQEQKAYKPTVGSYKDVDSISSAGSYVGELTANSLPYMAATMNPVSAFMMGGGLSEEAYDAQEDKDPTRAVMSGYGQMALEKIGTLGALGRIGNTGSRVKNTGIGAMGEGATEVGQDIIAQWGTGTDLLDVNPENFDEAFVGGASVGGAIRGTTEAGGAILGRKTPSAIQSTGETPVQLDPSTAPNIPSVDQEVESGKTVDLFDVPTIARNQGVETRLGLFNFSNDFTDNAPMRQGNTAAQKNPLVPVNQAQDSQPNFVMRDDQMGMQTSGGLGSQGFDIAPYESQPLEGELLGPERQTPHSTPVGQTLSSPVTEGEFESQRALPDRSQTIVGEDGRPMQAAQQQADDIGRDSQNLIPQKDIIFAEDNSGNKREPATINLKVDGQPFGGKKAAALSKGFKEAKENGFEPEVVPVMGGYGWQSNNEQKTEISQPVQETTITEGSATNDILESRNEKLIDPNIPTTNKTEKIFTSKGREVEVDYHVVEVDDLVASNDDAGNVNPSYPQALQPRDRTRTSSQLQINDIANNINPALLDRSANTADGAPIVSDEGIVESGNGRTLALKRAYEQDKAGDYKAYLSEQGYDVQGMDKPVLVRVRRTEMNDQERQDYTKESNERSTLSMSASEMAKSDAKKAMLVIGDFAGGDISAAANRSFVTKFMQGAVSKTEQASMIDKSGQLSQDGRRRVEAALIQAAYGDDNLVNDIFESSDSEIRAIGGALLDTSGSWAQMRSLVDAGQVDPGSDVTQNVIEAVNLIKQSRAEGRKLGEMVSQGDIFSGDVDPMTKAVLALLYSGANYNKARSRKAVTAALYRYTQLAEGTKSGGLFSDTEIESVNAQQLLGKANEQNTQQENGQESLFGNSDGPNGQGARGNSQDGERSEPNANSETDKKSEEVKKNAKDDADRITSAANEAATSPTNNLAEPTDAQKEAGNYKKGKVKLQGLDISIENPKGSTRSGKDESGKEWKSTMQHHYGDIKGTTGADGDSIDTFIGDNPESKQVFVVDQINPNTGAFDEHKVMIGFDSIDDAQKAYLANYEKNWKGLKDITEADIDSFKEWMVRPRKSKQPFAVKKATMEVNQKSKPVEFKMADETYATGKPAKLYFAKNKESAPKSTMDMGQGIEPAGDYLVVESYDMSENKSDNWDYGEVEFKNPLVLEHKTTNSTGWKKDLSEMFDGKTGKALSAAVKKAGYDGILTMDKDRKGNFEFSEAVNLTGVKTSTQETLTTKGAALADKAGENFKDFGEVLQGAKKHTHNFNEALSNKKIDVTTSPLSVSFPQPDAVKLIQSGLKPEAVAFIAHVRAQIPNKPKSSYKLRGWTDAVTKAREVSNMLIDGSVGIDKLIEGLTKKSAGTDGLGDILKLANEVTPEQIKELGNFKLEKILYNIYRGETDVTKWVATHTDKKGGFGSMGNQVAFNTKEEALAYVKAQVTTIDVSGKPATKLDVWRESGKYVIGKKIGTGKYIELETADNKTDAFNLIATDNERLTELLAKKKKVGSHRRAEQNERVGKDYRRGKNVTSDLFAETFGFRGVQFGNYVGNDKRQQDINNAYDGLLDLAGVLGVSPKSLSLNGELGLAFGARGRGGKDAAAAHFESGTNVINLTKREGAGSLAHEWFHALDNYFGRNDKLKKNGRADSEFLTEPNRIIGVVDGTTHRRTKPDDFTTRPEMFEAFQNIFKAIKKTELVERSAILDGRKSKTYWGTNKELGARTFEKFIIDNLAKKGYESDYLATIMPEDGWNAMEERMGNKEKSYPYPTDKESVVINKAFQNLFDTLETKIASDGNTIMFNRSKSTTQPKGVTEAAAKLETKKFLDYYKGLNDKDFKQYVTDKKPSEIFGPSIAADDNFIKGAYDKNTNTLYIFSANHESNDDIRATLREELLTHKGLGVFKEEEIGALITAINETRNDTDKTVQKIWKDIDKNYADSPPLIQAEEFLGKVSQEQPSLVGKYFNKIVAALVKLFRKAGFVKTSITMSEMRAQVYEIGDRLKKGQEASNYGFDTQGASDGGMKFNKDNSGKVKAFHGTGANFDVFSKDKLGGFTGADSASMGFFFTSNKGLAEQFKNEGARQNIDMDAIKKDIEALGESELIKLYNESGLESITPLDKNDTSEAIDNLIYELGEDSNTDILEERTGIDKTIQKYIGNERFKSGSVKEVELDLINPLTVDFKGKDYADNAIVKAINKAKKQGNDGVVFKNMDDAAARDEKGNGGITSDVYFVFESAQINDNSSLRFNRSQPTDTFEGPREKRYSYSYFKRKIQDKFLPIKEMQVTIEDFTGNKISDDKNVYLAEELYYGKTESDLKKIEDNHIKPLTDAMVSNKIDRSELDTFLIARHAQERNDYIASINPELPDGGSGMTNQEASDILQAFKKEGKYDNLSAVAREVYKITNKRKSLLRDSGLQDAETIDVWDAGYQYYVPLKGYAEDSEGSVIPRTGKGFDIRGSESMKALGRRSLAESPTGHAISDLTQSVIRARKNEVGQTMLKLVNANPNKELWQVFTNENPDTERALVNGVVKPDQPINMAGRKDDYFAVKNEGKVSYIKFKDKDKLLLHSMRNMGAEEMNTLTKVMSSVTRWLSMVNTSLNPEFTVTNFSRDIQTALFNALAEQDITDGKVKDKAIATKMIKGAPKAVRSLWQHARGKLDKDSEVNTWITEFLEDGAKTGYFDSKDVNQIAKDLESQLNMGKKNWKGNLARTKKTVLDFIEHGNSSIENGVRLSAYIEARKANVSRVKAASFAKNLTVNFNRKGEMGTLLNSLFMFFNAAVQGNANFARAILTPVKDEQTGKRKLNRAQKVAGGITMSAVGFALLSREMGGDDEDGEPYWDKIPKGVRERNLVILKSLVGGEPGEYWKIPLPYGYNIFYNLGDAAEAAVNSKIRNKGDLLAEMALSAYGSFVPLGSPVGDNAAESLLLAGIPTIGKPAVELSINKNFFGGNIYRENLAFGPQKADAEMSMRSTPEAYKVVSRFLNDITGGSEYKSGSFDVSPDAIEHMMEFSLGGLYRFTMRTTDNANTAARGGELELNSLPFARQLTGEIRPFADISSFYDARQDLKNVEAQFKALRGKERLEYKRDNIGKFKLKGLMKVSDGRMKALREKRDRIESDDSLAFAERERQLDAVQDQMKETVARFNNRWNKVN